jgi:nitroimidazol reductase NimA-like FMN-containing flavoprotein (pyridoxamine 5'-phosphate oxidase superfamily)
MERTEFGRLRTSGITLQLPRPEMEKRMAAFLKSCNICVLATCSENVPRATPIEYYADGLVVYCAAAVTTKIKNLEANPRISVGIYDPSFTDWTDWYRVKGMQITGKPEILRRSENPEAFEAALEIYDWRKYRSAMGMPDEKPQKTNIIKITPERIEYRDLGLMREDFAAKQVWETGLA